LRAHVGKAGAGGSRYQIMAMTLRRATIADADMLLEWQNDPGTRRYSRRSEPIAPDEHNGWLAQTLRDESRRLLITEEDGIPVGMVRADFADGAWELSWLVAPGSRGRDLGRRMVMKLAGEIPEPIRAEVMADNIASQRIAASAGMELVREEGGMLHYFRPGRG
jgi:RimJ/RimL family protein N-acetyltransferase